MKQRTKGSVVHCLWGLPLTATTELVAGKLEAVELADDNPPLLLKDILRGIRHINLQYKLDSE